MILCVPAMEAEPWPTLGPQVCAFIESYLTFGPGDLRGQPARIDAEKRALIYRMYEVYPQGHPQAGRRRYKRCAVSVRKGSAKTELGAWLAAGELHPLGPVRCDGFDAYGRPVGRGVTDPYIPLVAYTEEQSEDLAYGALRVILEHSSLARDFDIGLERIMRIRGDGKAVALASAPDARDGARTTWQMFDETHRFTLPRLKSAHRTMMANLAKRRIADPWSLETTTAPAPGEFSVAEDTMEYAQQVAQGRIQDSRLFFFHRQATETCDLATPEGIRAAVLEASGPDVAEWSDIEAIVEQFRDPTTDKNYLRRVWLNQLVRPTDRAFDAETWKKLAQPEYTIPDGAAITLGFDGARYFDSTALIATEFNTGFQQVLGLWEQPESSAKETADKWEVPVADVDLAVEDAFKRFQVLRFYCDPPYWQSQVAAWAGKFGDKIVFEWWTNRWKAMAYALQAYVTAMQAGEISHEGNPAVARHIGNAYRRQLSLRDDEGKPLWVIQKERPDSPFKIDAAMAGCLSWEARADAMAAGEGQEEDSVYEERGFDVW